MDQDAVGDRYVIFTYTCRAVTVVAEFQYSLRRLCAFHEPVLDAAVGLVADAAAVIRRVVGLVLKTQMDLSDGQRRSRRGFAAIIELANRAGGAALADRRLLRDAKVCGGAGPRCRRGCNGQSQHPPVCQPSVGCLPSSLTPHFSTLNPLPSHARPDPNRGWGRELDRL